MGLREARLKREVDAEPEVSLDAFVRETRGARAGSRSSRVRGARIPFVPLLLPEKKERAAEPPRRLKLNGRGPF